MQFKNSETLKNVFLQYTIKIYFYLLFEVHVATMIMIAQVKKKRNKTAI